MYSRGSFLLAALVFGAALLVATGAARAESNMAQRHAEMRQACDAQDGRFEKSWQYNDQGVKWGLVLSCVTSVGRVTCQDDVCESRRWARRDGETAGPGQDAEDDLQDRTDPKAFSDALAALSAE
jgi:hypothetical protein